MSFPAYPEYKDSYVPWLGTVPKHWPVMRLKNSVVDCRNGIWGDEQQGDENDIICIRVADFIRETALVDLTSPTYRNVREQDRESRLVRHGDLLIEKSGGGEKQLVGAVVQYTHSEPAICSNFVARMRLAPEMSSSFWAYVHSAAYAVRLNYRSIKQTSGIQNLDQTQYLDELAPFPPIDEQAAIAAFLDRETAKIDALVAEQERLIALLTEKRQAVISHAVTKGLNPDAPMKDSGVEWLGEIPAHWEIGPIKRYARVLPGYAFSAPDFSHDPNDWRLLRGINISPHSLRWGEETVYWSRSQGDGLEAWELAEGDLVIGMDRPWIGDGLRAVLVTEGDLPSLLLQRVASVRPKETADNRFLLRCFQHDAFYHHCAPDLTGVSVPHLSGGQIEEFRIPMPPLDEGRAIADHIEQKLGEFFVLIDAARSAIALLLERRAALISAAVTGKIDVRGAICPNNVVSIDTSPKITVQPSIRASVGALSIRTLGSMGRMAVMKGAYLAEGYAGISELEGIYQRDAAGPFCRAVIDGMERDAAQAFGIQVIQPIKEGERVTYRLPSNFALPVNDLPALFGEDRAKRLAALFDLLKGLNRDGVEAIATLFAVWNDLLACGKSADDDAIIRGVLEDWHPEKAVKFNGETLAHWLAWMRRNHIVPDGTAPRTDHQGSLFQ